MYAKKLPVKKLNDFQVYIAEGYSIKGKKKDRYYENLGLLSELEREHDDVGAFIKERIAYHEASKKERASKAYSFSVDYSEPIEEKEAFCSKKNASILLLNKVWADLKLEPFLRSWKFSSNRKMQYSINDALRLMCFSRIINPGSKLSDIRGNNNYVERFDLNIDNLYDSLDLIDELSAKLTRKLSKECKELMPGSDDGAIFYDCSNFYFEIQNADEEGLRAYGVEKNHRPDPIIEYGLLYHQDGYPIGSVTFRGNESETGSLIPLLINAGEEATNGKIICADAGLNTSGNKEKIHRSGRNYIFTQSLKSRKIDAEIRRRMIDGKGMTEYGEPDRKGRRKSYKSRWIIRGNGLQERLVVKFDPASYDFMVKTIEKRVEHAEKIIKSPSRLSLSKCSDGKEYIKRIVLDKNGEVMKGESELILSREKIEEEKSLAGYYAYVTDIPSNRDTDEEYRDELARSGLRCVPLDDIDIIKIGGKRNDIEECFRTMKTDMDARPIYVRKEEHIKAHMFTVYMALTIMCILRKKYLPNSTTKSIFESLRRYELGELDDLTYKTLYWDQNIGELSKKMNLNLAYKYHEINKMRSLIGASKKK